VAKSLQIKRLQAFSFSYFALFCTKSDEILVSNSVSQKRFEMTHQKDHKPLTYNHSKNKHLVKM
jgi:hypothetical protein